MDAAGVVKEWEARTGSALNSFEAGPHPGNALHVADDVLLLASGSGAVQTFTRGGEPLSGLTGHTGAVSDVRVDPTGEFIVSASSDGTLRTWA